MKIKKILLVSMPWASIKRPLLGVGILTQILNDIGYEAKSYYPNIKFSKDFGFENYEFFADNPSLYPLAEYLFASDYFNYNKNHKIKTLKSLFGTKYLEENKSIIDSVEKLCDSIIPKFISETTEYILENDYDIIGFSSTFNQIFPSLTIAKRIKKINQDKIIILGGSSFHGEMGIEYSKVFSHIIDYVFIGESDKTLPMFMEYLNGKIEFEKIDGIAKNGKNYKAPIPINNLDKIPRPNYDAYFDNLKFTYGEKTHKIIDGLPFESSRGCWWGQKNHCTFCGLNNLGMNYRYKNDDKIIHELSELSSNYKTLSFLAADNILRNNSYKTLLPKLASLPVKFNLFYEVKANMKKIDVHSLNKAGVNWIQPGIESFSTRILKKMRKGVTGIQNIQLLKHCKEIGVNVSYNILTGFKGEKIDDYLNTKSIMNKIKHLQPPSGLATDVQIHRFSPMHANPSEFGFKNMKPCSYYNNWFPDKFINIDKAAYFFEAKLTDQINYRYKKQLNKTIKEWTENEKTIYAELGPDFVIISTKQEEIILDMLILNELNSIIFVLTDEISNHKIIKKELQNLFPNDLIDKGIHELIEKDLIIKENDKLLNLIPFKNYMSVPDLEAWKNSLLSKMINRKTKSRNISKVSTKEFLNF